MYAVKSAHGTLGAHYAGRAVYPRQPRATAAERFYISIPGPTLSYVPLYYGQERGFFAQEGLDLQVLVVRGIVGVSSLMSGEIDVTCHAGSGFSAALRGVAGEDHLGHPRPADP